MYGTLFRVPATPHAGDTSRSGSTAGSRAALVPAVAAALLGVGLLVLVGFAGAETLHEAAHDARHAAGFPCH